MKWLLNKNLRLFRYSPEAAEDSFEQTRLLFPVVKTDKDCLLVCWDLGLLLRSLKENLLKYEILVGKVYIINLLLLIWLVYRWETIRSCRLESNFAEWYNYVLYGCFCMFEMTFWIIVSIIIWLDDLTCLQLDFNWTLSFAELDEVGYVCSTT